MNSKRKKLNKYKFIGKLCFKVLAVVLVIELNAFGLFTVGSALAYFVDQETGGGGLTAGTLDFLLSSGGWQPSASSTSLAPGDTVKKNITVVSGGSLGFQYVVRATKTAGDDKFCNALQLKAIYGTTTYYTGPLLDFVSPEILSLASPFHIVSFGIATSSFNFNGFIVGGTSTLPFNSTSSEPSSSEPLGFTLIIPSGSSTTIHLGTSILSPIQPISTWTFETTLPADAVMFDKTCEFKFNFIGWQENLATSSQGFWDEESTDNILATANSETSPPPEELEKCVKVNEVYYDPDTAHGSANDEWIELYNACSHQVNLKNWVLKDNSSSSEPINGNHTLDAGQFVVLSSNASTWALWPLIPSNAVKIALGGTQLFNGLNNSSDRVFLYDDLGNQIDEVSWGEDASAFDPAVLDVEKGHSIARKTKGVDTNTANDWEDLATPNPGTNPHSMLLVSSFIEQLTETLDETPETTIPEPLTGDENINQNDLFLSENNPMPNLIPEQGQVVQEEPPIEEPAPEDPPQIEQPAEQPTTLPETITENIEVVEDS